jgi:mRNA-degrading endonuclease toxin of MazEF toxin-antitoxin module
MDFDPQAGHEQMKRRPALVLSPAAFNDVFGVAYVAPVTTKPRGHAFEIPLPADSSIKGAIMLHQMKSLDWRARRARFAGKVSPRIIAAATEIVKDILEGD